MTLAINASVVQPSNTLYVIVTSARAAPPQYEARFASGSKCPCTGTGTTCLPDAVVRIKNA